MSNIQVSEDTGGRMGSVFKAEVIYEGDDT
jgi:hypothetical protein